MATIKQKATAAALALGILGTFAPSYISSFEQGVKVETKVYKDNLGTGAPLTVCAGLTEAVLGVKLKLGDVYTEQQCRDFEKVVISKEAVQVSKYVKVDITMEQMIALTDFVHNLGIGTLAKSQLLRHLNNNQCKLAAKEFNDATMLKNGKPYIWTGKTIIDRQTKEVLLRNGDTVKKFTTGNGTPLPGLIVRRNSNRVLFESGCD